MELKKSIAMRKKVRAIGLVKNTSSHCKEASFNDSFGFKDLIEYSHHR